MADVAMWQDKEVRKVFLTRATEHLAQLESELEGKTGVVAIEPESGDYFLAPTLGKANDAAFAQYPDRWVYFARLDDHAAAIALPTW